MKPNTKLSNSWGKLKKFLKERWYLAGGSILLLIAAIVAILVGLHMTGWSFVEWLKSGYATTFFVLILLGGLAIFALCVAFMIYLSGEEYGHQR